MTHSNRVRLSKLYARPARCPRYCAGVCAEHFRRRWRSRHRRRRPTCRRRRSHHHPRRVRHRQPHVTDADGRYNARGLRVGGPYTITSTSPVPAPAPGRRVPQHRRQPGRRGARRRCHDAGSSAGVVATAGSEVFSADKMGAGTNVTREQIENFRSIKRDLQDYARLDPARGPDRQDPRRNLGRGQNSALQLDHHRWRERSTTRSVWKATACRPRSSRSRSMPSTKCRSTSRTTTSPIRATPARTSTP